MQSGLEDSRFQGREVVVLVFKNMPANEDRCKRQASDPWVERIP